MVEVLVEFDYTAQEPDELNIKKGDIIKDVTQKPGGWWEGTLHDKKGVFPDNFVKILEKDVVLRNKRDSSRIRQCRAIFSYNQDHEDELNLKVGDVINIIGEEEEGWWRGVLNGKQGVFPSNFVEEITPAQNRPKPTNRDDLVRLSEPPLPAKPVKQLCLVRYSYKAQNEDELNLKEGDLVTILNKDSQDAGWWKGEIGGKVGVFPDNFVELLPQNADDKRTLSSVKADNKSSATADSSAIKPSSIALQRKSLEFRNAQGKPSDTKTTPPLPGKKPLIPVKKSPSGSGSGLFSKLKDKIMDKTDGSAISKTKPEVAKEVRESTVLENSNSNASAFDEVERRPLLSDVRANRARAPGRRLPTAIHKDDEGEVPGLPNGNADYVKSEYSSKLDDTSKSEDSVSSENLDTSSDLDANEAKPRVREWEKHKAPWLAEMKLSQAKRTSVSPVSDTKPKTQPLPEPKPEPEVSKSSHNSPAEKEVNVPDMSKSMSEIKVSPLEQKPIPKPYKPPPNELDKEKGPPIKSKPVVSSLSSVNRHSIGSTPLSRESPSRSQSVKVPPKLKPEQYDSPTVQKPLPTLTNMTGSYSSYSSSHISHSSSFSHASTEKSVTGSSVVTLESASSGSALERADGPVFSEILERLVKLEAKCQRQEQMIDELKNMLQVETEMRQILQEKISHNNVQV